MQLLKKIKGNLKKKENKSEDLSENRAEGSKRNKSKSRGKKSHEVYGISGPRERLMNNMFYEGLESKSRAVISNGFEVNSIADFSSYIENYSTYIYYEQIVGEKWVAFRKKILVEIVEKIKLMISERPNSIEPSRISTFVVIILKLRGYCLKEVKVEQLARYDFNLLREVKHETKGRDECWNNLYRDRIRNLFVNFLFGMFAKNFQEKAKIDLYKDKKYDRDFDRSLKLDLEYVCCANNLYQGYLENRINLRSRNIIVDVLHEIYTLMFLMNIYGERSDYNFSNTLFNTIKKFSIKFLRTKNSNTIYMSQLIRILSFLLKFDQLTEQEKKRISRTIRKGEAGDKFCSRNRDLENPKTKVKYYDEYQNRLKIFKKLLKEEKVEEDDKYKTSGYLTSPLWD